MERLKKARAPVIAGITRTVSELEIELKKAEPDKVLLQVKVMKVQKQLEEVNEMDEKLKELMLDENVSDEVYAGEVAMNEEYEDKARMVTVKAQLFLNPVRPGSPNGSAVSQGSEATVKRRSFKLPKIELKKFAGDPLEWLGWWAQFSKIHEDESLHNTDKFQYLSQAMVEGTRARRVVEAYPQSAENYPKVIEALKERFGDKVLLSEVYVRQLLKMVLLNNSNGQVQLSSLFDELESHIRALETLGVTAAESAVFLYPLVESSLPEEIVKVWQRSSLSGYEDGDQKRPDERLQALMRFLKGEVKGAERLAYVRAGLEDAGLKKTGKVFKKKDEVPTVASLHVGTREACIFCQKTNHNSAGCYKAGRMSLEEKRQVVKDSHSCFACLRKGHGIKTCRVNIQCKRCGRKHLDLMCPEAQPYKGSSEIAKVPEEVGKDAVKVTTTNTSGATSGSQVLMKTVRVIVKGSNGLERYARLLFDEESQRSYIKTALAEELMCPLLEEFVQQNNLFGGHVTGCKSPKLYKVWILKLDGKESREIRVVNEDVICTSCPMVPPGSWMVELEKMKIFITDTGSGDEDIQILIGSDLREKLMTGRRHQLQCGLVAVESIFGWTLSGTLPLRNSSYSATVINMLIREERLLPKLWDLETLGIKDPAEQISREDHESKVKLDLQRSITRDVDGRYCVGLPWISDVVDIPSNRGVAVKRLMAVTGKLNRNNEFERYDKVFQDWESEHIIEKHPAEDETGHFLSHRPVVKPESVTTLVRPVFDASCREGKGPSLNQCLEKGPNMLELIPSITLRFREKNVGAIADIRKAFQMIGVDEMDRNFQKFLWWTKGEMRVLRHCRVIFGMNCSPFILAAVLEYHLTNAPDEYREAADLLLRSLYVDNCATSLNSLEEYQEFKVKTVALLADAKMELRQWESNEDGQENHMPAIVLGMRWDKKEDSLFCLPPELKNELVVTKRSVLSVVAQVFDPIGFAYPALLPPKLMLQDSWATKIGWDQEWDTEQMLMFRRWYTDLYQVGLVRIPRQAFQGGCLASLQLHTFCDASKKAYGAVVYARTQVGEKVVVQLLAAKSRLAPLDNKKNKSTTINRLELMVCLIGVRLAKAVKGHGTGSTADLFNRSAIDRSAIDEHRDPHFLHLRIEMRIIPNMSECRPNRSNFVIP